MFSDKDFTPNEEIVHNTEEILKNEFIRPRRIYFTASS